jgi:hypothetical protein
MACAWPRVPWPRVGRAILQGSQRGAQSAPSRGLATAPATADGGAPPLALAFPGQGAQRVGMGKDLAADFAAARLVFEEVDEALQARLSRLMFEGPVVSGGMVLLANLDLRHGLAWLALGVVAGGAQLDGQRAARAAGTRHRRLARIACECGRRRHSPLILH